MTQGGRTPSAGRWISGGFPVTALALIGCGLAFYWAARWQYHRLSPLQQQQFESYARSSIAAAVHLPPMSYELRGIKALRRNAAVRDYLRPIFDGQGLVTVWRFPLGASLAALLLLVPAGFRIDLKRRRQRRIGKRLRGAEQLDTKAFNRRLRPSWFRRTCGGAQDGITIRQRKGPAIILPRALETSHASIEADTGAGKSRLMHEYCEGIDQRGETAIIFDPAREYLPVWFRPERGDVILDPTLAATWTWDSADEIRDPLEAMTIATSLVPHKAQQQNTFFSDSARTVVAFLLERKMSPPEIVHWLTSQRELTRLLRGTTIEDVLPVDSAGQRAGVMSPLNIVAKAIDLCPTPEQVNNRLWSAARWAEKRQGWIFITSSETTALRLQPIQTVWLDSLILRMMTVPGPQTWVLFEELAALQKLYQLSALLTRGRKHNLAVVLSYQGRGQIEELYGTGATETMLSQPANKFVLRTSNAQAAERVSKTIGDVEVERIEISKQDGHHDSSGYRLGRHVEPMFMPSQIGGFDNLTGVLKINNLVTPVDLPYIPRPIRYTFKAMPPRPLAPSPQDHPDEPLQFDPPLPVTPTIVANVSAPLE